MELKDETKEETDERKGKSEVDEETGQLPHVHRSTAAQLRSGQRNVLTIHRKAATLYVQSSSTEQLKNEINNTLAENGRGNL